MNGVYVKADESFLNIFVLYDYFVDIFTARLDGNTVIRAPVFVTKSLYDACKHKSFYVFLEKVTSRIILQIERTLR